MAQKTGRSPLEGLKHHYDTAYIVCPACGHEDSDGGWVVETDGTDARYSRECPSCGAVEERTVSLG
ncbi:MAG: HVO_0649 family zinc finger protein [Halolamina sp.]